MPNDSATREGATGEQNAELQQQIEAQQREDAAAKEAADKAAAEAKDAADKKFEEEAKARAADPRRVMTEEIASRRLEQIASESLTDEERDDQAAEVERKRLEAEAAAAAEAEAQLKKQTAGEGEPAVLKPDDLKRFKVTETVDGVTREVGLDEVVRRSQVAGAADYRLQKATETLARAEVLAREIAAAKGTGAEPGKTAEDPAKTTEEVDSIVAEALDKALDGDVKEAAKILAKAMTDAKGRSATPETADIVSAAVERIQLQSALTTFQSEYKDVASDKYLSQMVDREFGALVPKDANGEMMPLPPDEFGQKLREAGDKVRKWRDSIAGKKDDPAKDDPTKLTREQREAAKNNLDQTTGAHLKAPSSSRTSAEPTPQERSNTVAEIAKARGQQL